MRQSARAVPYQAPPALRSAGPELYRLSQLSVRGEEACLTSVSAYNPVARVPEHQHRESIQTKFKHFSNLYFRLRLRLTRSQNAGHSGSGAVDDAISNHE